MGKILLYHEIDKVEKVRGYAKQEGAGVAVTVA